MDDASVPAAGDWLIHGPIRAATNTVLLVEVSGRLHIYKPTLGEAPLWDFPDATLGRRELAVAAIDEFLGWGLVPPTQWIKDGPHGPGMLQVWVDHDPDAGPVRLFPAGLEPQGWLEVASGHDQRGRPVVLAHRDDEALRRVAALDAAVNNADRKGGHVLAGADGRLWAIDHGICLHVEPKLRTVLWGFAGSDLPAGAAEDLGRLAVASGPWEEHLSAAEVGALRRRCAELADAGALPRPRPGVAALPWPPM